MRCCHCWPTKASWWIYSQYAGDAGVLRIDHHLAFASQQWTRHRRIASSPRIRLRRPTPLLGRRPEVAGNPRSVSRMSISPESSAGPRIDVNPRGHRDKWRIGHRKRYRMPLERLPRPSLSSTNAISSSTPLRAALKSETWRARRSRSLPIPLVMAGMLFDGRDELDAGSGPFRRSSLRSRTSPRPAPSFVRVRAGIDPLLRCSGFEMRRRVGEHVNHGAVAATFSRRATTRSSLSSAFSP